MENEQTIGALVSMRAEIAGRLKDAEATIRGLNTDLGHVDATLRLFDVSRAQIAARAKSVSYGDLTQIFHGRFTAGVPAPDRSPACGGHYGPSRPSSGRQARYEGPVEVRRHDPATPAGARHGGFRAGAGRGTGLAGGPIKCA